MRAKSGYISTNESTEVCLQVASTTWIAEFLRLESNTTEMSGSRGQAKGSLAVKKEIFQKILSEPTDLVIFSTVRHPLER